MHRSFAPLLLILLHSATAFAQDDGWVALADGDNLDAWTILNGTATYSLNDGIIEGTAVRGTPNTFLSTKETYGDFALRMNVRVDAGINSGIQIRSTSTENYLNGRVHGYQVEIDRAERAWSGGIYDEARRGWLYPLSVNQECRHAFRRDDWNAYYIEAIGPSIRTWINDVPCAALYDDMTMEGFIALQVHSIQDVALEGKQVWWSNIKVKTRDLEPRAYGGNYVVNLVPNTISPQEHAQGWKLLFDGATTAGWRGAGKEAFPERGWIVKDGLLMVEASGGAEATYGGDIVTMDEYDMFEFSLDFLLTEGANSGIKYFITESYGSNASAIGLEYQLLDDERHADATQGAEGNRTVAALYDLIPPDPEKTVYPPGEWNRARLVVKDVRKNERFVGSQLHSSFFSGATVEHWLNDRLAVRYERGTPVFDALVARSKYAVWEGFGHWKQGHLLLQDHGDEVHFRSIKVRRIATAE